MILIVQLHRIIVKYRSRSDIITSILETTKPGATKTKIMYKSYLSYSQAVSYVKFLLENELIRYEEGKQVYWTTEKGYKLLSLSSEISDMMALGQKVQHSY